MKEKRNDRCSITFPSCSHSSLSLSVLFIPNSRSLSPSLRCWTLYVPMCAQCCSGSGRSPTWRAFTSTGFLIASSTGCCGATARACGTASPTPGRSSRRQVMDWVRPQLLQLCAVNWSLKLLQRWEQFWDQSQSVAVIKPTLMLWAVWLKSSWHFCVMCSR